MFELIVEIFYLNKLNIKMYLIFIYIYSKTFSFFIQDLSNTTCIDI